MIKLCVHRWYLYVSYVFNRYILSTNQLLLINTQNDNLFIALHFFWGDLNNLYFMYYQPYPIFNTKKLCFFPDLMILGVAFPFSKLSLQMPICSLANAQQNQSATEYVLFGFRNHDFKLQKFAQRPHHDCLSSSQNPIRKRSNATPPLFNAVSFQT